MFEGCDKKNEKEVLLMGGGHEPEGGEKPQEIIPRKCGKIKRGLSHPSYKFFT